MHKIFDIYTYIYVRELSLISRRKFLDLALWISEIQAQNAVELPPEFHMYNK